MESHAACRLLELRRLQRENRALHGGFLVGCADRDETMAVLDFIALRKAPNATATGPVPCFPEPFVTHDLSEMSHDPIEPPIHAKGPTWAHHAEDPPSFTP